MKDWVRNLMKHCIQDAMEVYSGVKGGDESDEILQVCAFKLLDVRLHAMSKKQLAATKPPKDEDWLGD